jgi:hypothetical protein
VKTKCYTAYGSDYQLDIIISEGAGKHKMSKPVKIIPERLVLSLSTLVVLMCPISLPIQPSFKLNIYNQCLNIDLVSPMYSTLGSLECYRAPNYKVCAGEIMRSTFIVWSDDESYGALICRLQRKQSHDSTEIGEDTSNTTQLLVVWRIFESNRLYVDILLAEHDKGFDWNRDNLSEFYRKNINQFRLYPNSVIEMWSLDANTELMTSFELVNGSCILNVTISEVVNNCARMPVYIDLGR